MQDMRAQLQWIQQVLKLLASGLAVVAAAGVFYCWRPRGSKEPVRSWLDLPVAGQQLAPSSGQASCSRELVQVPAIVCAQFGSNFLDVTSFGAVGDDSTDCTTAIQNALDAMKDGDVLFFPPGKYKTTSTVDVGGRGGTEAGTGGLAVPPKVISGLTVCGTRNSVIHHSPGTASKGFGHRVFDVHGPCCTIRDMCFWNREGYPFTGAGANINVQMSAEFIELAGLHFDVTGQNPIVVCCRGANIHDCIVVSSPEHGIYLSGAAYGLQQPTDTRIVNNHFENIAKNGIQVQNASADEYVVAGTIITGNTFRNCNVPTPYNIQTCNTSTDIYILMLHMYCAEQVGVFISESYVGLELAMPIVGTPPVGPVKGRSSGAIAQVDEGEWEAPPQRHPGWLRASLKASSYPAEFQVCVQSEIFC